MSVSSNSFYVKNLTDEIGIGVTLDSSSAVTAVTGPTWSRGTTSPTAVKNGGSIYSKSDGTFWITAGGGVWVQIGGASTGWALPDNVQGTWGTTSPAQAYSVFVSASNRFDLKSQAVTAATATASSALAIFSGNVTITGAVVGLGSGAVTLGSGDTDSTNAGGTGGPSGAVSLKSGAAKSTAGLSGSTADVEVGSGNSDDANSGNTIISVGTAGGVRGFIKLNGPTLDSTLQAQMWNLAAASATALQVGSVAAPGMITFDTANVAVTFRAATSATSGLTNLALANRATGNASVDPGFRVPVACGSGATTTTYTFPPRTGGWRIVDAYLISGGATGGTVQVQTNGGASNISNAMVPGNLGDITRATNLQNNSIAGGAVVRINITAGAPATEVFLLIEPR